MFQNIVTDKPITFQRYIVINTYNTLEEAKNEYENDINKWKKENKNTIGYKLGYPFGFATIKA